MSILIFILIALVEIQNIYGSQSSHLLKRQDPSDPRPPVILIPGLMSTRLVAWRIKNCRGSDIDIQDVVWLNIQKLVETVTFDQRCWLDCVKLGINGSDPLTCKLRPDEGLSAIAELSPGSLYAPPSTTIFTNMIKFLTNDYGYDQNSILSLPNDWRLAPSQLESRDHYFTQFKSKIELLVISHRRPAILIAHSMGNQLLFYFHSWLIDKLASEEKAAKWLRFHIWTYVGIAAPLLGASSALRSIISGNTMGMPVSETQARDIEITFTSTHLLNPRSSGITNQDSDDHAAAAALSANNTSKNSTSDTSPPPTLQSSSSKIPFDNWRQPIITVNSTDPSFNFTSFAVRDVESGRIYKTFAKLLNDSTFNDSYNMLRDLYWKDPLKPLGKLPLRPPVRHVIMLYGVDLPTEVAYSYTLQSGSSGSSGSSKDSASKSSSKATGTTAQGKSSATGSSFSFFDSMLIPSTPPPSLSLDEVYFEEPCGSGSKSSGWGGLAGYGSAAATTTSASTTKVSLSCPAKEPYSCTDSARTRSSDENENNGIRNKDNYDTSGLSDLICLPIEDIENSDMNLEEISTEMLTSQVAVEEEEVDDARPGVGVGGGRDASPQSQTQSDPHRLVEEEDPVEVASTYERINGKYRRNRRTAGSDGSSTEECISEIYGVRTTRMMQKKRRFVRSGELRHSGDATVPYGSLSYAHTWLEQQQYDDGCSSNSQKQACHPTPTTSSSGNSSSISSSSSSNIRYEYRPQKIHRHMLDRWAPTKLLASVVASVDPVVETYATIHQGNDSTVVIEVDATDHLEIIKSRFVLSILMENIVPFIDAELSLTDTSATGWEWNGDSDTVEVQQEVDKTDKNSPPRIKNRETFSTSFSNFKIHTAASIFQKTAGIVSYVRQYSEKMNQWLSSMYRIVRSVVVSRNTITEL